MRVRIRLEHKLAPVVTLDEDKQGEEGGGSATIGKGDGSLEVKDTDATSREALPARRSTRNAKARPHAAWSNAGDSNGDSDQSDEQQQSEYEEEGTSDEDKPRRKNTRLSQRKQPQRRARNSPLRFVWDY